MSNIITNTDPGNFLTDGVYIDQSLSPPATPGGAPTGRIAIVGTWNYGPVDVPFRFTDAPSMYNAAGNGTLLPHSGAREALSGMPECIDYLGVRVTDDTDTPATMLALDIAAGTLVSFVNKLTGSYPNNVASDRVDLKSGTISGSMSLNPVFRLTLNFPNAPAEIFDNIIGYAALGNPFDAATFKANVLAVVNGTIPNVAGSSRWTAVAGAGTALPVLATNQFATGGTDGASGVTTADLVGQDGIVGRTGIYALEGMVQAAQVIIAGLVDPTVAQTIAAFAVAQNCITWEAFPVNTATDTAVGEIASNDMVNSSLALAMDWDYAFDPIAGATILVSPIGKLAGAIAAQPAYQYPGNQQVGGVVGISSTERIVGGISTISQAEAGERESNGLMYLGFMPRNQRGPQLGLPFALMSDGSLVSDVRMLKSISFDLQNILGQFVGSMISTNPNDPTLLAARDAVDAYFDGLKNGPPQKISNYTNILNSTNNTPSTIAKGFLIANIAVQTLSAARFVLAALQVGSTVQIIAQTQTNGG